MKIGKVPGLSKPSNYQAPQIPNTFTIPTNQLSPLPVPVPYNGHSFIDRNTIPEADRSKIYCDHVSILPCSPIGNGAYEYFLSLVEPSLVYKLLGKQVLTSGEPWKEVADKIFQDAKLSIKPEGILRIDRWYAPGTDRMSTHVVYAAIVKPELKQAFTRAFTGAWLSSNDLIQFQQTKRLLSPDVADIILSACVSCSSGMQIVPGNEFTYQNIFTDQARMNRPTFEIIIQAAEFRQNDLELLYKEFMSYSVPYLSIGFNGFASLMLKLGWMDTKISDLFRTFDLQSRGGLTFRDLLYGLAAVEPATPHGGPPAEIRCRYIFRFYDKNVDGKLGFDEFKLLVADIRRLKGLPDNPKAVLEEAERSASGGNMGTEMLKNPPSFVITEDDVNKNADLNDPTTLGNFPKGRKRSTSRRPSFFIGEEKEQIPVTIVGPNDEEITPDDIVVPPDGGWGWMIVFAAFMSNLIVDGTVFSFGIMQDEIVKTSAPIESDREPVSTVAWVGSLLFGFTLLSGPFVSALTNKFGFRTVAFAGSIISSLAFVIAWLCSNKETGQANIIVMFLVYGVIGGIGFSLIYVPAVCLVGFYFEKRRALATGIAICGSGCGTFIYAPLCSTLIKKFGWHNALLIQAALVFSCCIFASLYRPLKPPSESGKQRLESNEELVKNFIETDDFPTPPHTPLLQRTARARDMEKWDSVNSVTPTDTNTVTVQEQSEKEVKERKISTHSLITEEPHFNKQKRRSVPTVLPSDLPESNIRSNSFRNKIPPINLHGIVEESEHHDSDNSGSKSLKNSPVETKFIDKPMEQLGEERFAKRRVSSSYGIKRRSRTSSSVTLMLSNSTIVSSNDVSGTRRIRVSSKADLNKPFNRDDIFLAASLQRIPQYSTNMINAVLTSGTEDEEPETKSKFKFSVLSKMLDFSLMKSPTFIILSLSGFVTLLGYSVPFIYLKGLAVNHGVEQDQATLLISIIGVTNTIGRIVSGGIADNPKANALIINNVALTVAGIATCGIPFLGSIGKFPIFITYSCVFGFSMACFASLRSILVVELLGLNKLTNAFGLLLLFQGVSAMIGSPLAGFLFDLTGKYDISFYVAGCLMLISGILCYPLHIVNAWELKKIEEKKAIEDAAEALCLSI